MLEYLFIGLIQLEILAMLLMDFWKPAPKEPEKPPIMGPSSPDLCSKCGLVVNRYITTANGKICMNCL